MVILLHRDLLGEDKEEVRVIVAKNRFGGTGNSLKRIKFKPKSQRFVQVDDNRLNYG